ncbi:MAG: cytochrome c biogenesis protein CcsA [Prevotella sp.]|nr:cytochrome c biogenesis protein CcsA [Prevotella sp.]
MLKKTIIALYTLIVVCIGLATIIEKFEGTPYVSQHIYGAWWFVLLWAVLSVTGMYYMLERRLYKRLGVLFLHLSFVVILIGALTTHLFSFEGSVTLRTGKSVTAFTDKQGVKRQLPFTLTLRDFKIVNYPGTDAPLDFQSIVRVSSESRNEDLTVSMNHIGSADGYRLFQSSYDSDAQGVTLGVYHDPWGIAITYTGYLLLLVSIIWVLFSRNTQMRHLYRQVVAGQSRLVVMGVFMLYSYSAGAAELQTVDREIAQKVGSINVLYNDRICPINTVAIDFVTKLSGKSSWEGYSADEIFVSWMIYYSPWEHQKLIRIKSKEVQRLLGIDGQWASFSDFIDLYNEYKLKKPIEAMQAGKAVADRKGLLEADEKYNVVAMFYQGEMLKLFPYHVKGRGVMWFKPGSQVLPPAIPLQEQFFIKQSMDYLTESIVTGQRQRAYEIIAKIKLFQREMIGDYLPSETVTRAEIFYNSINTLRWPVFLSLTLSLLMCVLMFFRYRSRYLFVIYPLSLVICLTLLLSLRWWVSGHVPVSNGYETMQFMAWAMLIITLVLQRRFAIISGLGTLIASFCLLVAMIAGGSPQITPLMPVLQSPLLSIHVMTVMCAYALFALITLLSVVGLLSSHFSRFAGAHSELPPLRGIEGVLLYPAVFLLTTGIFLGAIWANVSWGTYWSWDPKETWALITLMIYAVPLHAESMPQFRNPRFYHLYMIFAFLSVLTTYFGVNYLLGGMHSYA